MTRPDTEVVFDPATYVAGVLARTSALTPAGLPSYLRSNFQRGGQRPPSGPRDGPASGTPGCGDAERRLEAGLAPTYH